MPLALGWGVPLSYNIDGPFPASPRTAVRGIWAKSSLKAARHDFEDGHHLPGLQKEEPGTGVFTRQEDQVQSVRHGVHRSRRKGRQGERTRGFGRARG